jgi:hypothetical protein
VFIGWTKWMIDPNGMSRPAADKDSAEHDTVFQAGTDGKPCDGETLKWRRGQACARVMRVSMADIRRS